MKRALVIALGLFVAACGGGEYQDLKEELKKLTADLQGKVRPPAGGQTVRARALQGV